MCAPLWLRFVAHLPLPLSAILITVDTLRADRLSCYGYRASSTPGIDRLAAEGARFVNAYCDMPWTTGSMASVMTGVYGPQHGVRRPWNKLAESHVTMAEIFRENGFATAAFVGSFPVDSLYGLDQGFKVYDDRFDQPLLAGAEASVDPRALLERATEPEKYETARAEMLRGDAYRSDESVTAAAVAWLELYRTGRFFMWVHYFGPHERLEAGNRQQRRRIVEDYDLDLRETDIAVARLLQTIDDFGIDDTTVVVLHSDHGQALGEHGTVGHGRDLYEASVRIPLLIRLPPMVPAQLLRNELVRNIDILPTLLDVFELPPRVGLAGRSLLPLLRSDPEPTRPVQAYMEVEETPAVRVRSKDRDEIFARTSSYAVREGGWKYILTNFHAPCTQGASRFRFDIYGVNPAAALDGKPLADEECMDLAMQRLYDVRGPIPAHESANRSGDFPGVARRLAGVVAEKQRTAVEVEAFELTPGDREKLRSLGYLE